MLLCVSDSLAPPMSAPLPPPLGSPSAGNCNDMEIQIPTSEGKINPQFIEAKGCNIHITAATAKSTFCLYSLKCIDLRQLMKAKCFTDIHKTSVCSKPLKVLTLLLLGQNSYFIAHITEGQ